MWACGKEGSVPGGRTKNCARFLIPLPLALVSASSLSVLMSHISSFLSPSSVSILFTTTLPQALSSKPGASQYLRPRAWLGVSLRMRISAPPSPPPSPVGVWASSPLLSPSPPPSLPPTLTPHYSSLPSLSFGPQPHQSEVRWVEGRPAEKGRGEASCIPR